MDLKITCFARQESIVITLPKKIKENILLTS